MVHQKAPLVFQMENVLLSTYPCNKLIIIQIYQNVICKYIHNIQFMTQTSMLLSAS